MKYESVTAEKDNFLSVFERKLLNGEYRLQVINRDLLKYLALFLMTIGHWAFDIAKIFPYKAFLRFAISAEFFAPPVFFFFIAEGYHYTKSKQKYALRLFIFAAVTQIPHSLNDPENFTLYTLFLKWSVLMTLFLGLIALILLHSSIKLPLRIAGIAVLMLLSYLLKAEWAVGGILVILFFDLTRKKPIIRLLLYFPLMFCVVCVMLRRFPNITAFRRFLLPIWSAGIVITFFYNGKKGRFPTFSKYFFYIWYPLHLFLQWLF